MNPQHRVEVVFGKRREDDLQERSVGLARMADLMRSTITSTSVTLRRYVFQAPFSHAARLEIQIQLVIVYKEDPKKAQWPDYSI